MRVSVTLGCSPAKPAKRLLFIFCDALSQVVHGTEEPLRTSITTLGQRLKLTQCGSMVTSLASGDTFVASGETLNGHGVEPDIVVLPRQSDLSQGRDSVFEAALAWVREPEPERAPSRKETPR